MIVFCFIFIYIFLNLNIHDVRGQNEGDYTDEVCFRITEGENIDEFYQRHPGFLKHKELNLGNVTWYCAKFNQSTRTKSISKSIEDLDVQKLKDNKEVLWAEQQKEHIRVKKTLDPEWPNLWHLNGDVLPSMKISDAWEAGYTGRGIVIAIVDDGLQSDHPDLAANVDTTNGIDIVDGDDDPSHALGDSHGTHVAGLIAAERDNNECSVGVAYQSKIVGVRILGGTGKTTDFQEAQALSYFISHVDIYSNSWGPQDGYGFYKPGTITQAALQTGTSTGRGGKGVIYTWAAGNGEISDNCNADGYVNSIYTIGITSVQLGQNAWYSEVCSAAMAATYGGSRKDRYLTTTTTYSECTSSGIEGTSYSTPIASGIIALTLQANPNLTWRDIQHLIVLTSNKNGFSETYSNWTTNAAGKEYSQVLGFGFMDAKAMVNRAITWNLVPDQQKCTTFTTYSFISTFGSAYSQDTKTVFASDCSTIRYLEHVTVTISFSYTKFRGVTELYLVSPGGTTSHLLNYRYTDALTFLLSGSLTWTFMSVHFWRESPVGTWTLKLRSYHGLSVVTLNSWSLTFYGTTTDPLQLTSGTTVTRTSVTSGNKETTATRISVTSGNKETTATGISVTSGNKETTATGISVTTGNRETTTSKAVANDGHSQITAGIAGYVVVGAVLVAAVISPR